MGLLRRAGLIATLTCGPFLGGCALRPQVAHMAVEYNQFVAQATDRQTALNILRARDREPLHFTSFTKVVGSAQVEGNAGFGDTINTSETAKAPNAAGALAVTSKTLKSDALAPTLSVKVDTGTDFEIAINSTDDFWKGILEPVSPALLVYYLRQGWNPDLMSYLFIDRMDLSVVIKRKSAEPWNTPAAAPDDPPLSTMLFSITNEPGPPASILADGTKVVPVTLFDGVIRCRPLSVAPKAGSTRFLPISSLNDLEGVAPELLGKIKTAAEIDEADASSAKPAASTQPAARSFGAPLGVDASEPQDYSLTLAARADEATCDSVAAYIAQKMLGKIDPKYQSAAAKEFLRHPPTSPEDMRATLKGLTAPPGSALFGPSAQRTKGLAAAATQTSGGAIEFKSEGLCDPLVNSKLFSCDLSISVTLRSVEGVIYYLGEIQRQGISRPLLRAAPRPSDTALLNVLPNADGAGTASKSATPQYTIPILVIDKANPADEDGSRLLTVDYKGDRWVVPSSGQEIRPTAGRSSEVITLVEQLLNLYRTAKDFPSTPFVKILN